MIPRLTPDYDAKNLQVMFSFDGEDSGRGIIFNPDLVPSERHATARRIYNKFFARGETYNHIGLSTRQGPGELAKELRTEFGAQEEIIVGGLIAQLNVTLPQVKQILQDMRNNPTSRYESQERIRS